MPDALPIPDDLIQLQRDYDAAQRAVDQFVGEVDAGIGLADVADVDAIAHTPGPEEPPVRHEWTEEQHARLNELRQVRQAAMLAMHRHPTMVQARAEGCSQQTEQARRAAARTTPEA
jgi:hypothetical protein